MAVVVIQMGHVPRTRGATGTVREQEFARALAPRIESRLVERGHHVSVIGADEPVPRSDVFVALHLDGSLNRDRHGGSVGYPSSDSSSRRLAQAWKAAHQQAGYSWGFLPDNYTAALAGYYGFGRSSADHEFLAEHGHATNPEELAWLFANLDAIADGHVRAIGATVGHPIPAGGAVKVTNIAHVDHLVAPGGGVWIATRDGGIFAFGAATFYGSPAGLPLGHAETFGAFAERTLEVREDGRPGYQLRADDGHLFHFPIYDPDAPNGWRTS